MGTGGGAIMAHNIDLGGGKFNVSLRDTAAPCGGAIATLDANNMWGGGPVTVDGSHGGALVVRDAVERNTSLGCLTIEANLFEPPTPGVIHQPCSGCASPGFAPSKKAECTCATQAQAAVRECCSNPFSTS